MTAPVAIDLPVNVNTILITGTVYKYDAALRKMVPAAGETLTATFSGDIKELYVKALKDTLIVSGYSAKVDLNGNLAMYVIDPTDLDITPNNYTLLFMESWGKQSTYTVQISAGQATTDIYDLRGLPVIPSSAGIVYTQGIQGPIGPAVTDAAALTTGILADARLSAATAATLASVAEKAARQGAHSIDVNGTTALGYNAAAIDTSANATAVGSSALVANTTGTNNTAVGQAALFTNTTGSRNNAFGQGSLRSNTTGVDNNAMGQGALGVNTGDGNVAIGSGALGASTTAGNVVAVGTAAMSANTTGAANVAVGYAALGTNTTGVGNTAVGNVALLSSTANNNTALGSSAMQRTTTGNNTAVGSSALLSNTTGTPNTAVGQAAMQANTTGGLNTAVGQAAMLGNTTGSYNSALGQGASQNGTTANANTAIGSSALASNSTGNNNTAVGASALTTNTASSNTAVGTNALRGNTTGAQNTAVGHAALQSDTAGANNTGVGFTALYGVTTGNSNTAVGYGAGYVPNGIGSLASTTGNSQTLVGFQSGQVTATPVNNVTAIGANATVGAAGAIAVGVDSAGIGATTSIANEAVIGTALTTLRVRGPGLLLDAVAPTVPSHATRKDYVDAADILGLGLLSDGNSNNPIFADWPVAQPLPTGVAGGVGTTATKETAIVRTPPFALRYTLAATVGTDHYVALQTAMNKVTPDQYTTAIVDFQLISGTLNGAGIIMDYIDNAGTSFRTSVLLGDNFPGGVTFGRWYRFTKTFKRPAGYTTVGASATAFKPYLMGNWSNYNTTLAKDIIFDRVDFRAASAEEISAFNAEPVISRTGAVAGQVATLQAGGGLAFAVPTQPGPAYNIVATNFPKYRRAISRVRATSGICTIVLCGDSTTGGDGSTPYVKNYPSILTSLLNTYHIPTVSTWMGNQGSAAGDLRVTRTGAWTGPGGPQSDNLLLGCSSNEVLADTGTITYSPTHQVDSFKLHWLKQGGWGSFTYSVDGAAAVTVSCAGVAGIGVTTITGLTKGIHTLVVTKVANVANGVVYMGHVRAWDSTANLVEVMNAGMNASTASGTWNQNPTSYGAIAMLGLVAPDLAVLDIGINDAGQSVTDANYKTAIQNIINAITLTGDVLLKSMVPSGGAAVYSTYETIYANTSLPALSVSNKCGYLDGFNRWGGLYATSNSLGYYVDTLHPSAIGYSDVAQAVFNVIREI